MLRRKALGNIFVGRDLISASGPAPNVEASKSFRAPPGDPDRRGWRPFRLCQAPQGGLIRRCFFVRPIGGGVTGVVGGYPGHLPEGAPHITPLWETLRGNSRPTPSGSGGGAASFKCRGYPPQRDWYCTCSRTAKLPSPCRADVDTFLGRVPCFYLCVWGWARRSVPFSLCPIWEGGPGNHITVVS